jgi:predicted RNA-binding protein YlxR (DUF448 family)
MVTQATQDDLLDAGPRKAAALSERYCAATSEVKPVDALIRFVVAPDGAVVPDLKRRLPGRGIWITATRQALAKAVARKVFARGFKRDVVVTPELVVLTDRLIEQAALDALAICHKAGRIAIGFGKTESAVARGPVVGLLHAADASPDGKRKLASALQYRDDAAQIAIIDTFASTQLDLALGRSNVVHAALLAGPESEMVMARAARLEHFRTGPVPGSPDIGKGRKSARVRRAGMTKRDKAPETRASNWDRNG